MAATAKDRLRGRIGHLGAEFLRRAGRIRWRAKYKALRDAGVELHEQPRYLTYVLLDPEFDNFTFELANEADLLTFLHQQLGVEIAELHGYLERRRAPTRGSRVNSGDGCDGALTTNAGRRWAASASPPTSPPER